MTGAKVIGAALPRKEDYRFVTGQGRYLDDIVIPSCLHAHFIRSPHAHARIVAIDCAAALKAEGVVTIVTGRELAEWTTPMRMAPPIEGLHPVEFTTLPTDKVRFIGDPVVCIVAADRYLAEDAAELVTIDYEVLDPVPDLDRALAVDAPLVDESLTSNLVSRQGFTAGDPTRRFAEAEFIVEASFHQHRQTHAPLETRGCCAVWDQGRRHLTMHIGNQVPHPFRTQLARRMRLTESQVTVACPDILEVARHAGLKVPETALSEDGQVLAIRRFDRLADGSQLGVEDFCALRGLDPVNKYKASLEDLAKLLAIYVSAPHRKESARRLFTLLLLNYALRNADAHLKKFAVVYSTTEDVRLAPVYDIVTVTAYPEHSADIPGLPLAGKRTWASGKLLAQYGGARLNLSSADMAACMAQVTQAIRKVMPLVSVYAERYPEFREVASRMLDAWAQGIEDIKPDAKLGKPEPAPLHEQAGLSAQDDLVSRKKTNVNVYVDPDGAFGHKAR